MPAPNQNPNFAQQDPCTFDSESESLNGRNFTFTTPDSTPGSSPRNAKELSGKPFNLLLDRSRARLSGCRDQGGTWSKHEHEMARSKELAWKCLKAERTKASAAPRQLANPTSGTNFDIRTELLRRQAKQNFPYHCMRLERGYKTTACREDMDSVFNRNVQPCSPDFMKFKKDLLSSLIKVSTPKYQRSKSCPSRDTIPHSSSQNVRRVCPQPTEPVYGSHVINSELRRLRTSSTSPTAATKRPKMPVDRQLYTPSHTQPNSPRILTQTITTTTRGISPQQAAASEASQKRRDTTPGPYGYRTQQQENTPNTIQNNAYKQIPSRALAQNSFKAPDEPFNLTNISVSASPPRPDSTQPLGLTEEQESEMALTEKSLLTEERPTVQRPPPNLPAVDHSSKISSKLPPPPPPGLPAIDSSSKTRPTVPPPAPAGLAAIDPSSKTSPTIPPSPPPLPPIDTTRETSRNVRNTDQSKSHTVPAANATLALQAASAIGRGLTTRQPPTTQIYEYTVEPEQSNYYNAPMFNEPRQQTRIAENVQSDLADDGQHSYDDVFDDMDISGQELISHSAYPTSREDNTQNHSWRIPQDDFTCVDFNDYDRYTSQQASTGTFLMEPTTTQTSDANFDPTRYRELHSSLANIHRGHHQVCPPCEQATLRLYQSLAQKLSSTYEIISTLTAPQSSSHPLTQSVNQAAREIGETINFGSRTLLYGAERNDKADKASKRDPSKRYGRTQLDISDKHEVQYPLSSAVRNTVMEALIQDSLCPGIIQETIDGSKNFNTYYFNLYKDIANLMEGSSSSPNEDPITLLELFSKRIEKERAEVMKILKENATEEQIEESINQYFANQYPSDLNRSIKSLLISEHLQGHAEGGKSRGISLETEVHKLTNNLPGQNLKIIAYIGHTKTVKDE